MASPFRVFRKYQKTLLVVAGVILMFVFVIGDSLVAYLGGSRGGSGAANEARATAVSWDGGQLTNQELANLLMRRRMINAFLQRIEYAGMQSAIDAGIEPRELHVQRLLSVPSERSVVATKLFAEAAREAGMMVSDDAIVRYLYELGRGQVSPDQMRAMISQPGGARVPVNYMMEGLREELLAHNYLASHQYAFATVTPQQRHMDWLRVNDRIIVEAAAVPAESFVVDVADPSDAELAEFFAKYREREPQPDLIGQMEFPSPVPGFRMPRKIGLQVVQANYDQYLTKVQSEITDADVQKYYDDFKDPLFIKADTNLFDEPSSSSGAVPGATPPAAATDSTDAATAPAAESAGSEPAPESTPKSTPPPATPPADQSQPAETNQPADESSAAPTEGAAETATPEQPAGTSDNQSAPATGDQSSQSKSLSGRPFRLAAFLQEPADNPASGEAEPTSSTTAADGEAQPASDVANAGSSGETAASASEASAASTADTPAANSDKPKEFQPLDEVRDQIRRTLAEQRAAEQLSNLMTTLHSQLNGEFTKYFGERLAAETAEREPPAPPAALTDLAPLAAQHGLTHLATGPLSWLELRKLPVGTSGDVDNQTELFRLLFGSTDVEMYQPVLTEDIPGNRYLVVKVSDTPGRVPELAEVRDQVVHAWKLQKAAELAQKRAEELAKKAQEAKSSLADALANESNVSVIRTDPFSRYTGGDVAFVGGRTQQQPFRLSEPTGIVAAGPSFMDKVFSLKEGEVGAVLNHDQSIAYVVRVVQHELSEEELRNAYLAEANNWPGIGIMMNEHLQLGNRLLAEDVLAGRSLVWERDPDLPEQSDDEQAEGE